MKLTNKAYDVLKKISLMAVPLATFITAISKVWGFAWGTEVCATISAVGIFLGACLEISTRNYQMDMVEHADEDDYSERG